MTEPSAAFNFQTVPSLRVEWGGARALGVFLAERFSLRRVLVVTDSGLRRAGVLEPALASLAAASLETSVFDGVLADPPEAVVHACIAQGRSAQAELVLGFGGGSSLDVAKVSALRLSTEQQLADCYGIGRAHGGRLPLVQVPTTAGTGSEMTDICILTTGEITKLGIVAPQLFADHVLLDAELSLGLPPLATAATGIDAMVHAIEAYTSRHRKNPISDVLAREALRLLAANLLTACHNGRNRQARESMLLGACLAGQAFTNAPVAAVHALAYPLGGRYHVAHGISNALMLGPVLRYNLPAAAPCYAELADVVLGPGEGDARQRAQRLLNHLEQLMDTSGAPRRLRDAGVEESMLPQLAADAMLQTRLLRNNPVELSEADALALYREAW